MLREQLLRRIHAFPVGQRRETRFGKVALALVQHDRGVLRQKLPQSIRIPASQAPYLPPCATLLDRLPTYCRSRRCAGQAAASAVDPANNFIRNLRQRENAVGKPGLGHEAGHAPHHRAGFILNDDLAVCFLDVVHTRAARPVPCRS